MKSTSISYNLGVSLIPSGCKNYKRSLQSQRNDSFSSKW